MSQYICAFLFFCILGYNLNFILRGSSSHEVWIPSDQVSVSLIENTADFGEDDYSKYGVMIPKKSEDAYAVKVASSFLRSNAQKNAKVTIIITTTAIIVLWLLAISTKRD